MSRSRRLSLLVIVAATAALSTFSFSQAPTTTVGVPWYGGKAVTETVGQIMARQALLPTTSQGEREGPEMPLRPTPGVNPDAPPVASWPPVVGKPLNDIRETFLSPQAVGTSFRTISSRESPYTPPDCGADVGPTQVLVHLNGYIKVFSKSGVLGGLNATDDAFWASVNTAAGESDPHIRYDRVGKRWIVVCIDVSASSNYVLIAVSSDSVISSSASFSFYRFKYDAVGGGTSDNGGFMDYPTLGVDANALYIGGNIFNAAGTQVIGTSVFVVRKSALYTGSLVVTAFRKLADGSASSGVGPWTPQGVDNDDPAATEGYFIGGDFFVYSLLDIYRISNPGGTPSITGPLTITVPTTAAPILQPHLGQANANRRLDALDDRLYAAQLKKNKLTGVTSLWTAHNIAVNTSGVATGSGTRNGSRWYEIGNMTTTPTLTQSGTLFDPASTSPRGYWIPSVAMTGQGHMVLGSSYAGLADRAGVAAAGRLSSDAAGSTQAATTAVISTSSYNYQNTDGQRWGDYSQTVVDPVDDMTVWTFQEYCDSTNTWATRAVQLRAPLPAAPTAASPASIAAGASNVNVTITGTASGGTGFFDPGAGYAGRIAASVSGTGVTVNSVTFTSPTSITLNLSVSAGATLSGRTVTVTNPDGQSATSATNILTITTTCPTITVSPVSLTNGAAGSPTSQSITASGGTAPYTYAVTSGALPAGVSLSSAGLLSGTPTYGGSYGFTVTATDANSCTGARAYTWTVTGCPQLTLAPATLPNDTLGIAYSQTLTTSGGTAAYAYLVIAGSLPTGLSLASGGALTGTPTATGTFNFTVQSTDQNSCTTTRAYAITVHCPIITLAPTTLPGDTIGKPYSQSVTASGGTPAYAYAVSAGALPPGLTLSSGGALTGTLTTGGTYNFTVQATDSKSCTGTRAYAITVYCPPITLAPTTLPSDTIGKGYSQNVTASGGTPAYTYTVSAGTLPTGLSLSASGAITGTLTATGTFNFTVQATDANNCAGTRAYAVTVYAVYVPNTIALTVQGAAVIQDFDGLANTGTTSSTLPTGWLLLESGTNANTTYGIDNGAGTAGNTYSYGTTSATDRAFGTLQSGSLIPIIGASVTNKTGVTMTSLGVSYVGEMWRLGTASRYDTLRFEYRTDSTGIGNGTSWVSVPALLFRTPDITGTAGARDGNSAGKRTSISAIITGLSIPNNAEFFIRWVDANATSADDGLALDSVALVANAGGGSPTNPAVAGAASPASVVVGNTALLSATVTPGTNPASTGLAVTANLTTIGGSASQALLDNGTGGDVTAGDNIFSYRATVAPATTPGAKSLGLSVSDAQARNGAGAISLSVLACPTITLSPASLPAGVTGSPYSQAITPSGGTSPYAFALQVPDTLPSGLTLSGAGTISGTPTRSGAVNFTVVATDSNGCTGTRAYAITVTCPTITLAPADLPAAALTYAYAETLAAAGGTAPYAYTLQVPDTLPAGLVLGANGVISGTPSVAGLTDLTVIATDANGCTGTRLYSLQVDACPQLSVTPPALTGVTTGATVSQQLSAAGGRAPYSFVLQSGAFPAGLSIAPSGLVSGTVASGGPYAFTVGVTDSTGCQDSAHYSGTVACPAITVTPASLPVATVGSPYSQPIGSTGGHGAVTYAVTLGALPAGCTLSGSGTLAGTPTGQGNFVFTVTATDSFGCTGARVDTLHVVCPAIAVTPTSLPAATAGAAYAQQLGASGGTPGYAYAVTLGALPAGLSLTSAGLLHGTPSGAGSPTFTVTATDTFGCSGARAYTLSVGCAAITVLPASLADDSVSHAIGLTFTASGGAGSYTYAVTSGALPPGLTLGAGGALSGTVTSAGTYAFTVTATASDSCTGSTAYSWLINPTSQQTVNVAIANRWNILSSPLAGSPVDATTLYPSAVTPAYAYVPGSGYVPSPTMAHGGGYWLKFNAAGSTPITGFPLLVDSLAVLTGWNLVGALATPIPAASVTAIGTTISSSFYAYANGYATADTLQPGHGYWVNVTGPGTLVYSGGLVAAAAPRPVAPERTPLLALEIGDAAGNRQELFLARAGEEGSAIASFLPPAPPKGVFDARFTSDRMSENLVAGKRQEFPIRVSSAQAPVTVRWHREGGDERLVLSGVLASGAPLRAELEGEGSVTLRSASHLRVVAEPKKVIPTTYALLQNYPNPFNPVTTLQFDLPVRSAVTLVVLNILGEEVARIYDQQEFGPGREEAPFDASRLASGIYFYRLSAKPVDTDATQGGSPFTSTRKMTLLK